MNRKVRRVIRWYTALPLLIFTAVHLILLYNAVFHEPLIGYDGGAHLEVLESYSQLSFPTPDRTHEFFSPPLPYLVPAFAKHLGLVETWGMRKLAQLLNVGYSIILFLFLMRLCRIIQPNDPSFQSWTLAFLGMMPVYYKSFAFIRGEPLLATLGVVIAYVAMKILPDEGKGSLWRSILLGVLFGLAILARQWAFFLIAGVTCFIFGLGLRSSRYLLRAAGTAAIAGVMAIVTGGWFYWHLYSTYGKISAFNRAPAEQLSLSSQPASFYLGLGLQDLFTDPVRPSFVNQLIPTFYSELWGDWECYFSIYGRDTRTGRYLCGRVLERKLSGTHPSRFETNRHTLNRYLGRCQLLSLLPSLFLIAGALWGVSYAVRWIRSRGQEMSTALPCLSALIVFLSLTGYCWFLLMFPSHDTGISIKATYMLQIFPFLSLLAAYTVCSVTTRFPTFSRWLPYIFLFISLHNIGLTLTHYPTLERFPGEGFVSPDSEGQCREWAEPVSTLPRERVLGLLPVTTSSYTRTEPLSRLPDEMLRLDFDPSSADALLSGWSGFERAPDHTTFVWALGCEASLVLTCQHPCSRTLFLRLWPYRRLTAGQRLRCLLNSHELGVTELENRPQTITFDTHSHHWQRGSNLLVLQLSQAVAPAEVKEGSNDRRILSVAVDSLNLSECKKE